MDTPVTANHPHPPADGGPLPTAPDTRQSWAALPKFCQPFLTWLSGKPLPDEAPWRVGPWHHLAAAVLPLIVGVSLAAHATHHWILWAMMPAGWLLAVHGMRKLRTGILHQCSHHNFSRHRWLDTTLGHVISLALFSEAYPAYQASHVGNHHSRQGHMTMADPTVQFVILRLGLRGGMPRRESWRKLRAALLSPLFYLNALTGRIASHFSGTSWPYRLAAIACHLTLNWALIAALGVWCWLVAWMFPLWILFSASAALRLSCRHTFPKQGKTYPGRAAVTAFTDGIFIGEPAPRDGGFWRWTAWWVRLGLIHLPQRLFVLPLDGPTHDFHHRSPRHPRWPVYPFLRRDDLLSGHRGWPAYTETWGVFRMIDRVYGSLEDADPAVYCPRAVVAPVSAVDLSAALND